jgi:hypothetical protein
MDKVSIRSEPDYWIELALDNPSSEGIDRKSKLYDMIKAEAKKRGIKKGDSVKRLKRIRKV